MENLNSKEIVLELIEELKDELERIYAGEETRETRFIYTIEYVYDKLRYNLLKKLEEEKFYSKKFKEETIKQYNILLRKNTSFLTSTFNSYILPSLNKRK